MSGIALTGIRAENPMGFLVALGTLWLASEAELGSVLSWARDETIGTWSPALDVPGLGGIDELAELLLASHRADTSLDELEVEEVSRVQRERLREALMASEGIEPVCWRLASLLAEVPDVRGEGIAPRSPFCLFPIRGKRSFLGTLRKQTGELTREQIRACLTEWRQVKGPNTLRLDPGARVQENAIMAEDPSAAGLVGVLGAAPLAAHGLRFYPLVPTRSRERGARVVVRPVGIAPDGAFTWPIWEPSMTRGAVRRIVAAPEEVQDGALLGGLGVAAVFRSDRVPLKEGWMLSWGERVA